MNQMNPVNVSKRHGSEGAPSARHPCRVSLRPAVPDLIQQPLRLAGSPGQFQHGGLRQQNIPVLRRVWFGPAQNRDRLAEPPGGPEQSRARQVVITRDRFWPSSAAPSRLRAVTSAGRAATSARSFCSATAKSPRASAAAASRIAALSSAAKQRTDVARIQAARRRRRPIETENSTRRP